MEKCKECKKKIEHPMALCPECYSAQVSNFAEKFCDKYCRFPHECKSQEELDEHCDDCDLITLLNIGVNVRDEVNEKEFDYGVIVYKHRFNMTRSLDDYNETALNKCIRIGLKLKYKTIACDKLIYEMQIVYKDENNNLQCLCLDLNDWTVAIKHIGNMQCNI